jgi:hypothetical protein
MNYDETWEAMSNLEDAFNQITPFSNMLDQLQEAVDRDDRQSIVDITAALNAYVPVYIAQYDKASKRAWNKTVRSIHQERNYNENLNYEEIKKGLESEPYTPMHHPV